MRWWALPDWSGDWRLEPAGADACTLTIHDPTPAEVEKLGRLLKVARSKGWVGQHIGFVPNGEVKIALAAPITKVGRSMLGWKPKGLLTAVRSASGTITTETDTDKAAAAAGAKDADAAATVHRPTLCCPYPQPGPDHRASEVLEAFCTPQQWADWQRDGVLRCYGGFSGRQYEIAHRHHPLAVQRGKIIWDVEGAYVLHAYDWSVPPAEEVLACKLVLEHQEHWIRNASGMYFAPDRSVEYRDPFMSDRDQWKDGVADAAIVRSLGLAIAMYGAAAGKP